MGSYIASLHGHSNYSDGTDSPEALIEAAADQGVTYLALTDHDLVNGVPEFYAAADNWNARHDHKVIPIAGIEMMTVNGEVIFLCSKPLAEAREFLQWVQKKAIGEPAAVAVIQEAIDNYDCLVIAPHPNLKVGGMRSLNSSVLRNLKQTLSDRQQQHMALEVHNGGTAFFLQLTARRESGVQALATEFGWSAIGAADYHVKADISSQVSQVHHAGAPSYEALQKAFVTDQISLIQRNSMTVGSWLKRFWRLLVVVYGYHGPQGSKRLLKQYQESELFTDPVTHA